MLPGGYPVEWLAAGTFDRKVGFSLFTLQVTHKIEENIDVERDFVVETVMAGNGRAEVEVIKNFSTGYHSRNGGGDLIETDGDLPIVDLRRVDAPAESVSEPTDSRSRRPAQTVFGAGVTVLRGLIYLAAAVVAVLSADYFTSLARNAGVQLAKEDVVSLTVVTAVVLLVAAVVDIVLALCVLWGRNWARIWLMSVCVFTTTFAFVANVRGHEAITLANLPTVGSSILVLLALSSHRARDYAIRTTD